MLYRRNKKPHTTSLAKSVSLSTNKSYGQITLEASGIHVVSIHHGWKPHDHKRFREEIVPYISTYSLKHVLTQCCGRKPCMKIQWSSAHA